MHGSVVRVHEEVEGALREGRAVVALETAVLTHGLPRTPWKDPAFESWLASNHAPLAGRGGWDASAPLHLEVVRAMSRAVRAGGAVPAVVGMLGGVLHVGLDDRSLEALAASPSPAKLSARDLGPASVARVDGGTTVAGTLAACQLTRRGIRAMATGGIGGVHRGWSETGDVSADLRLLAEVPVCLVASGAKSILDLSATLEMLDTLSVPVIGHRVDDLPRFTAPPDPSLRLPWRHDSIAEVAATCRRHWIDFRRPSAVLLANPVPPAMALDDGGFEELVEREVAASRAAGHAGAAVTPDLLRRLAERSGGRTLRANVALLLSNASLAAEVASAIAALNLPES